MNQDKNTPWKYKPDNGTTASVDDADNSGARATKKRAPANVSWEAAEFIEHHHGIGWYAGLIFVTALLAAGIYLAAKDIFATVIVAIVGGIVGVFASQKPGQAKYEITSSGLKVNDKLYSFGNYKSFTVIREGNLSSANLFPLKRLMPPLTAYFNSKEEPKIIEAIGNHLPYDNRPLDSIDRLTRRLRL